MMPWKRGQQKHRDLDTVEGILDAANAKVSEQEPRVNALVSWLEARKIRNGFGEDFEWTLAHPRRSGG